MKYIRIVRFPTRIRHRPKGLNLRMRIFSSLFFFIAVSLCRTRAILHPVGNYRTMYDRHTLRSYGSRTNNIIILLFIQIGRVPTVRDDSVSGANFRVGLRRFRSKTTLLHDYNTRIANLWDLIGCCTVPMATDGPSVYSHSDDRGTFIESSTQCSDTIPVHLSDQPIALVTSILPRPGLLMNFLRSMRPCSILMDILCTYLIAKYFVIIFE